MNVLDEIAPGLLDRVNALGDGPQPQPGSMGTLKRRAMSMGIQQGAANRGARA